MIGVRHALVNGQMVRDDHVTLFSRPVDRLGFIQWIGNIRGSSAQCGLEVVDTVAMRAGIDQDSP